MNISSLSPGFYKLREIEKINSEGEKPEEHSALIFRLSERGNSTPLTLYLQFTYRNMLTIEHTRE